MTTVGTCATTEKGPNQDVGTSLSRVQDEGQPIYPNINYFVRKMLKRSPSKRQGKILMMVESPNFPKCSKLIETPSDALVYTGSPIKY